MSLTTTKISELDYMFKKDAENKVKTDTTLTSISANNELIDTATVVTGDNVWLAKSILSDGPTLSEEKLIATRRNMIKMFSVHGTGQHRDYPDLTGISWNTGYKNWIEPTNNIQFTPTFYIGLNYAPLPYTSTIPKGDAEFPYVFDYKSGILTFLDKPYNANGMDLSLVDDIDNHTRFNLAIDGWTYSGPTLTVLEGGSAGQALVKKTQTDYDVEWATINSNGVNLPSGTNPSDYLYWDGTNWVVGDTEVRIGANAGENNQGPNSVAIGRYAGQSDQPGNTIILNATGTALNGDTGQTDSFYVAPVRSDNTQTLALAYNPSTNEVVTSTSISNPGGLPSGTNPSDYLYWDGTNWAVGDAEVRIGANAGIAQGVESVAIGAGSGETYQQEKCIAIGSLAGHYTQGTSCIAIGESAGSYVQQDSSIAIGQYAGNTGQAYYSIAIGTSSGSENQGIVGNTGITGGTVSDSSGCSIAIGLNAGKTNQITKAIAIGLHAGKTNQSTRAIAIGTFAGEDTQLAESIAIGSSSGTFSQSYRATSIGSNAGYYEQSSNAIAIGSNAGYYKQSSNAIAIGNRAGNTGQGENSIALGQNAAAGAGQIVLNATGGYLTPSPYLTAAPGFFVNPIATNTASGYVGDGTDPGPFQMGYDTTTKQISMVSANQISYSIFDSSGPAAKGSPIGMTAGYYGQFSVGSLITLDPGRYSFVFRDLYITSDPTVIRRFGIVARYTRTTAGIKAYNYNILGVVQSGDQINDYLSSNSFLPNTTYTNPNGNFNVGMCCTVDILSDTTIPISANSSRLREIYVSCLNASFTPPGNSNLTIYKIMSYKPYNAEFA